MTIVREIMTTAVITLSPDTEITAAAKVLLDNRINGAPVLGDKGELVGILCQSDLIVQQKNLPIPTIFTFLESIIQLGSSKQIEKEVRKIAALTVREAMTAEPVTVSPDTEIETVAELMVDQNFHTLPVVEGGQMVGIIGKEDVLRTLLAASGEPPARS